MRSDDSICLRVAQLLAEKTTVETATLGGVLFETGAFAWVFDLDSIVRVRCSGPADCSPVEIAPKRAELYGILSFLTFIRLIVEYYACTPTATLNIYCDDKTTINDLASFREMQQYDSFATTKRCCANYDLIAEILPCMKQYASTIRIHYVKGHQDKDTPLEELSTASQLNCVAHSLCSQQLQRLTNAQASYDDPGHFPHQQCSVIHQQRRITGLLPQRLKTIGATPHIEKYWKRRFHWSQRDLDNLDRRAFTRVHFSLPKSDQRRIIQFRCGWLPVNQRCSKWMKTRTDICPCCRTSPESVDHMITCWDNPHPTGDLYSSLHASMTESNFHPTVKAAILDGVTKWLFPDDIYPQPHSPPPACIQLAIVAQDSIGWANFLRGFPARQWLDAHATLSNSKHDTPKLLLMGAAMVRPCLQYFLERWKARNATLHGGTKEEQADKQQLLRNACIDEYQEAAR
jgi:hypothetical protein